MKSVVRISLVALLLAGFAAPARAARRGFDARPAVVQRVDDAPATDEADVEATEEAAEEPVEAPVQKIN